MSFANGKYAKIWEIKPKENYTEVKISTSRKNQEGEYVQDFGAFVRFVGKANDKIKEFKGDEHIKLLQVETTNRYSNEKQQMYYNFVCFDFEKYTPSGSSKDNSSTNTTKKPVDNNPPLQDDDDDIGLPF